MTKRITLFCSSFPPETGAAPGRMYHLAIMLQQKGFEVQVIAAMPNYPTGKIFSEYRRKFLHKEIVDGISVTRIWLIPTHSSNKIKRAISLLSYTFSLLTLGRKELVKSKPDLIILSSPPFVTGYIGGLIAKITKAKILLNVSDLWPKTAHNLGFIKEGKLLSFLQNLELKMYQNANAISAQSNSIKKHIESLTPHKKIFVYRNLQPAQPTAKLDRPEGKRKIVYSGLLGIAQGVAAIVQVINFAALGTELHLYGQGYELRQILDFIKQHPENGVYYHGSVSAKKIPEILTQYHAMLIPLSSNIEGAVPSKIFNAYANGLPILFCGHGEAAEIIDETQTGLTCASGDYQVLSHNIQRFISFSEEEYNSLRQNCLQCNESQFNKSKQDTAFVDFLSELQA
ncbi:MAG: glycosyltransferase family 4 protein [Chitinophagaceae bacterium]|jgi:glycosyltransferase involved in cell wall biosynthesis